MRTDKIDNSDISIRVAPLGNIDTSFLIKFKNGLQSELGRAIGKEPSCFFDVGNPEMIAHYKLPIVAYNHITGKYNSHTVFLFGKEIRERTLKELGNQNAPLKILILTDYELYKPGYKGVFFGEAEAGGDIAVIVTAQLKDECNELLTIERTIKEALHVIGYTLGLEACNNPSCIMFSCKTKNELDIRSKNFCEDCLRKIAGGVK